MPLSLQEKFDKAVACVQGLPTNGPYQPDQDTKLKYYKYYKQATIGDCNTTRPGMLDFVGKAKWDAWNGVKGVKKEDAQRNYVALLVKDLKEKVKERPEDLEKVLKELEEE